MKMIKITNDILREDDRTQKIVGGIMAFLLMLSMLLLAKETADIGTASKSTVPGDGRWEVIIDAGHGAADSGKIGINKALEKDINLQIAVKVKRLLEAQDIQVYMTREDDTGFYPGSGSNKKVQDMKKRVAFINEIKPDLTVSIHQNSFEQESICGAQTFFYGTSKEGEKAAELMQEQLITTLDKENRREAKNNSSYYLLKKTETPIIIVECGFLSNRKEAELLITDEYQEKAAWAIHLGILRYLNS